MYGDEHLEAQKQGNSIVFNVGIGFVKRTGTMKSFSDRIWLVLLGIAVAIVVLLTTFYWSNPASSRSSEQITPGKTSQTQTILPRLSTEILKLASVPPANK